MKKLSKNTVAGLILSGISIVGFVATTILVAKETPKAIEALKKAEEEKMEPLTTFEKVQVAAPIYIPAAATGVLTIGCNIGAMVLTVTEISKLTAMYAVLDQSFKNYREHVNKLYGEDADLKVQQDISLEKHNETAIEASDGTVLVHEPITDTWFDVTVADIYYAEMHFNRNLQLRGYNDINELLEFLGQEPLPEYKNVGWTCDMIQYLGYAWVDFYHNRVESDDPDAPEYIEFFYPLEPIADIEDFEVFERADSIDDIEGVDIHYTLRNPYDEARVAVPN